MYFFLLFGVFIFTQTIVNMGPLYGVTDLREKHRYNITPWARRLSEEEETDTEDEERLAVAAAMFGVPQRFKKGRNSYVFIFWKEF